MIATTGAQLLPPEAIHVLQSRLLPLATIVTPNIPEALFLLRQSDAGAAAEIGAITKIEDAEAVGRAIRKFGPKWVLVKGGHCPLKKDGTAAKTEEEREMVVDVLVGEDAATGNEVVVRLESQYYASRNTHGTGCSLACEFGHASPLLPPSPFSDEQVYSACWGDG